MDRLCTKCHAEARRAPGQRWCAACHARAARARRAGMVTVPLVPCETIGDALALLRAAAARKKVRVRG